MIYLREIKTEPLFMSSENVENYEMHHSGFGTVVIDKDGFVHHVMESLEEVEEIIAKGSNVRVGFEIGIGKAVSQTYIQIELPNNVPSNVKPIVILPNMECGNAMVKVNQYGKNHTMFEFSSDLTKSHVINMNTGV